MISVGIPSNSMSNFSDVSTLVEALCILKLNCQPLFKYSSTVLALFFLNLIATSSSGSSAIGILMLGFLYEKVYLMYLSD